MAETATVLLSDPEKHERFKTRARERAVEVFDADRIIPQYESYYQEVLAR